MTIKRKIASGAFILLLSGFIVFAINRFSLFYNDTKAKYEDICDQCQSTQISFGFTRFIEDYIKENGKFPNHIDALYIEGEDRAWYEECLHSSIRDFLSDSLATNLQYIPLYDSNKQIIAAVLLSVGIDGKMNTVLNETDTIYVDRFLQQVRVYNTTEMMKIIQEYDPVEKRYYGVVNDLMQCTPFTIWNYWFGSKDYLMQVIPPFRFVPNEGIEYKYQYPQLPDTLLVFPETIGIELVERIKNSK